MDENIKNAEQWGRDQVLRELRDDMKGVREVMNTFAQKSDVTAIAIKLEDMVPRREFDKQNASTDKRIDSIESVMKSLATKEDVARLSEGPVESWVWTMLGVIIGIAGLLYGIFVKGAHV